LTANLIPPITKTPNQGLKNGTKAIRESKTATIKLTGVKLNNSKSKIEHIKCQIAIKHVACTNLVTSPISSCLF